MEHKTKQQRKEQYAKELLLAERFEKWYKNNVGPRELSKPDGWRKYRKDYYHHQAAWFSGAFTHEHYNIQGRGDEDKLECMPPIIWVAIFRGDSVYDEIMKYINEGE